MIGKVVHTTVFLAILHSCYYTSPVLCTLAPPYTIVAAIDFGTTFSGYGYSTKDNPTHIIINNNWGAEVSYQAFKTPTSVLVNSRNELVEFGIPAENIYTGFAEAEDAGDDGEDHIYHLYRHFKMLLYKNEKLTRSTTITSVDGRVTSAMGIFVKALEYLKKHMINDQAKATNGTVDESLIKWVVTVPAIWSEEAKQFMREAAFHAGLTKSKDSSQLIIALEPEAASMHCRNLNVNHFVERKTEGASASFSTGTKYMVIDAGGGTIDLTAHEILDSGKVKEIYRANGGGWGGTQVDANFISLLDKLLGTQCIASIKSNYPQQWMRLMISFEQAKRVAKPDGKSFIAIAIPFAFSLQHFEELCEKSFTALIKESDLPGIHFRSGLLRLNHDAVVSIYQPVIDKIINHIAKLIENSKIVKSIRNFLLVGGFAESEFLQKAIVNKFEPQVKVIIPKEAQLSVIKGAVLFGHNEEEVTTRIMHKTYGTSIVQNFDSSVHPHHHKVDIDGVEHCKDVFDVFVEKDEEIRFGEIRQRTYRPSRKKQVQVDVDIYATDRKDVKYVDEVGVEKLGSFILKSPNVEKGLERSIHVNMTFGGTEIKVEARDVESGSEGNIVIDFLSD